MTILEPDTVVVSPAPTHPAPPDLVVSHEPELRVIRHRRRRAPLASAALGLVLAVGVVFALWAAWPSSAVRQAPATAPPSYVQLTGVTAHTVSFRWSAPLTDSSVVGYEVVRNGVVAAVVMPVQSSYVATGLASGRAYSFRIIAVYAHSVSAPSAPIGVTTTS